MKDGEKSTFFFFFSHSNKNLLMTVQRKNVNSLLLVVPGLTVCCPAAGARPRLGGGNCPEVPKKGTSVTSRAAEAGRREGCLGNLCSLPGVEGVQSIQAWGSIAGDRL